MTKYHLALTEEETALLQQIDLARSHPSHTDAHEVFKANREPILALLALLGKRGGIPEHRIRYWTDPEYNPGRIKGSRESGFKRNGTHGDEIYSHPNFVRHLRYLLHGSELPPHVSEVFERQARDPQWVSSSDAIPLGKFARKLTRENGMTGSEAAEEFFKLALDIGLSLDVALVIMRSVQQVR